MPRSPTSSAPHSEASLSDERSPGEDARGPFDSRPCTNRNNRFRACDTDVHCAAEALRERSNELARAQAVAQIGSWHLDFTTGHLAWSDETYRMFGVEPGAPLAYNTFLGLIPPSDRDRVDAAWQRALRGEPYDITHRIILDGAEKWVRERAEIQRDESGRPLSGIGTVQDVTELTRAQLELSAKEADFRALVEASAQIVWTCGPHGEFREDSPSFRAYTGLSLGDFRSFGYAVAIHEDEREGAKREFALALENVTPLVHKHRLRHREEGRYRWVVARALPLRDNETGAVLRWVGMTTDVHEQEMVTLSLQAAKEAAEVASRAKTAFLATMSHEIRTPLNGILGLAQLLQLPGSTEAEVQQYATTIVQSGRQLLELLNDILDLSQVEAGRLVLERQPFDVADILREVEGLFRECANEKGLTLAVSLVGPLAGLLGDRQRLRQMLSNLVSNAVKFSDSGTVVVEARELHRDHIAATVEFSVRDHGIGVPESQRDRLFGRFTQLDDSRTRKHAGSGLGLAIVQQLANQMGGDAGMDPQPAGPGSRFWFTVTLPLSREVRVPESAVTRS